MEAERPRVLVVDDDAALASTIGDGLVERGYDAVTASTSAEATAFVRDRGFDIVVTDLRMPDVDGIALLELSRTIAPERPVIVMTAFGAVDSAVETLRKGAYHYLLKPFKVAELDIFIRRALDERALRIEATTLRRALRERYSVDGFIAESAVMRELRELVERVAHADVPVVLYGETGTGKGLVARVLHGASDRAGGKFVSLNCAALPENLLESELFGHVKGAFTGATSARNGLFVEADGGTLFLDEIGDMVPALQAKLLDALERRVVRAVGASREREIDVRVVAATHRDLRALVASGGFREDLLYRLEGIAIEVPPLRLRRDDLPHLVSAFIASARASNPRAVVERLSHDAMDRVLEYSWPGNVRELEHAIARAVLLGRSPEASASDLPPALGEPRSRRAPADFGATIVPVREIQRRYAAWVLDKVGGRKMLACEKLGIDAKTLNKWLADEDAKQD